MGTRGHGHGQNFVPTDGWQAGDGKEKNHGESVPQGIGGGVMANGVSESIPQGMVNGVRDNGVSKSVPQGIGGGGIDLWLMVLVSQFLKLDKERLLGWFNQEVIEDLGRLREYQSIARGLRVAIRRRREHIRQLTLLRNCQDAADTIRL
nr:hypothetical protein [Tanacetum cinerariifolium]